VDLDSFIRIQHFSREYFSGSIISSESGPGYRSVSEPRVLVTKMGKKIQLKKI
jgi:hypothetical protein